MRVAPVVHGQHVNFMLLGQGGEQVFSYAAKTSLYVAIATIKDACHKKIETATILRPLFTRARLLPAA